MATVDKTQIFTAEAIRVDTAVNSIVADTGEFQAETIVIYNGLNQSVSIQLQGSHDNSVWIDIGEPFSVAAGVNDYDTVTDYFPIYRIVSTCSTAPTTGDLDAWILKAGAVN